MRVRVRVHGRERKRKEKKKKKSRRKEGRKEGRRREGRNRLVRRGLRVWQEFLSTDPPFRETVIVSLLRRP